MEFLEGAYFWVMDGKSFTDWIQALSAVTMAAYAIMQGVASKKNETKLRVLMNALVLSNCFNHQEKSIPKEYKENVKSNLASDLPENWIIP